ncbi:hypothetical protein AB1Y20_013396 [Prymnesium parvum]|uniref:Uncharacterized protein n=1 Tax=Prymnesium parvum TaxID=97485 RepID=A0AB34IIK9_PRYPA
MSPLMAVGRPPPLRLARDGFSSVRLRRSPHARPALLKPRPGLGAQLVKAGRGRLEAEQPPLVGQLVTDRKGKLVKEERGELEGEQVGRQLAGEQPPLVGQLVKLARRGVVRTGLPLDALARLAHLSPLSTKLVLSCYANLCYLGLASQLGAEATVRDVVIAALHASKYDREMVDYVLPVAFHLADTIPMLRSLTAVSKSINPLLRSWSRSRNPDHRRHASVVLAHLKAHKNSERERQRDDREAALAMARAGTKQSIPAVLGLEHAKRDSSLQYLRNVSRRVRI